MNVTTHQDQLDSADPSSGVTKFWLWLKSKHKTSFYLKGLEMGCGKGGSVIWLAKQGVTMSGFDLSQKAISVAQERSKKSGVDQRTKFTIQDATKTWDYPTDSFDFMIDCFATTHIESRKKKEFVVSETMRVVRPYGYILACVMSTDLDLYKGLNIIAEEYQSHLHWIVFEK